MKIASILGTVILATSFAVAQTPTPIVVQAVPAAVAPAAPQPPQTSAEAAAALKTIGELKVANDEILKAQAATLQQLDELQKAVEQLKIYSKRG